MMKSITNIAKSASKIVFIMLATGATVGLFTGHVSQDNYMILATAAFAFYFSHKGETKGTDFAGK